MTSRSLTQLSSLTWITFQESIRHRALLGLVVTALSFMAFSLVLSALAVRDQALRVVTDFGLFSLSLLGVAIAIILGVILVHKEIERKTIYTVLSKPVPRPLFVVGKYLGLCCMLTVTLAVLVGAWWIVLLARGGAPGMGHVAASLLVMCEVWLVTAVAVFFSTFATPVTSGVFTFGIFLIGRNVGVIEHLLGRRTGLFVDHPELRPVGKFLATAFPDLTVFQVSDFLLHGMAIQTGYIFDAVFYAASYVVFFLAVAVLLFQRRDFI